MKSSLRGLLLLAALPLLAVATPANSETPTPASQPNDLRADLSPRIRCGDVTGTTWPVAPNLFVTAYHVTSHATVACSLPATHEKAYILNEDTDADIAHLFVRKPREWYYSISCNGYIKGASYFGAGWPKEGFKVTPITASGKSLTQDGYWWGEQIFDGPPGFEHGQSGGPVVDPTGVVHGIVNGGTDSGKESSSRSLSDTALCRGS